MTSFRIFLLAALGAATACAASQFRAGFATADLTPPVGLDIGGFGYNLGRSGDSIHDHLLARAVVLESGNTRIAIVGCDLGGLNTTVTRETRAAVEAKLGIPAHSVMITATHTHSAPVVANWIGTGKQDPKYLAGLPGKIAAAIIAASERLQPVFISWGEAPVTGVARNREYPDGPVDPAVRVLKFSDASGKTVGFIANYSVHPVVMAQLTRMVTGDLAGVATDKVMQQNNGAVGIFLQGSCGDINPIYAHMPLQESLEKLDLLATRLAGSISQALASTEPVTQSALAMTSRPLTLPLVPPEKMPVIDRLQSAERWLKTPDVPQPVRGELEFRRDSARAVLERFNNPPLDQKTSEVQAASIGDVVIVANPGETFLAFGKAVMEALGAKRVIVTGYANDYVGYIPKKDRYELDASRSLSYPAYMTPWLTGEFRFREDVGDVLVHEMITVGQDVIRASGAHR